MSHACNARVSAMHAKSMRAAFVVASGEGNSQQDISRLPHTCRYRPARVARSGRSGKHEANFSGCSAQQERREFWHAHPAEPLVGSGRSAGSRSGAFSHGARLKARSETRCKAYSLHERQHHHFTAHSAELDSIRRRVGQRHAGVDALGWSGSSHTLGNSASEWTSTTPRARWARADGPRSRSRWRLGLKARSAPQLRITHQLRLVRPSRRPSRSSQAGAC